MDHVIVRLPFLHPASRQTGFPAQYLWPGLPHCETANCWTAAQYPFSITEAARLLAEFRKLDLRDLETMRLMLGGSDLAAQIETSLELADLGKFTGSTTAASSDPRLQQAHKVLIWFWLMEENLTELSALAQSCDEAEASLLRDVLERNDTHAGSNSDGINKSAANELNHLLPWRACVASAAFFIPPQIPVFMEGQMLDDLREASFFENAETKTIAGTSVLETRAPLWRVLGHSRETEPQSDIFNAERAWICQ